MRKITPANAARRRAGLSAMLSPRGVQETGIRYLAETKRLAPAEAARRIARMKRAGVPLRGLVWKLSANRPQFNGLVERYGKKGGLDQRQLQLRDFLRRAGVSEKAASPLVKNRHDMVRVRQKIQYFKSIRLDPKIYGIERMPVSAFEGLLGESLSEIKEGINKKVLWPLEDARAAKQLRARLRGWSKSRALRGIRPATLLERATAALANGIKPTPYVLANYSAEQIAKGKARARHSMDAMSVARAAEEPLLGFDTLQSIGLRLRIVDELAARPHLAVKRIWLMKQLRGEGIKQQEFRGAMDELKSRGVISSQDGYIRISQVFRTGTLGPTQHRERLRHWFGAADKHAAASSAVQ